MPAMALTRPTANLFRRGRELLESFIRNYQQTDIVTVVPKQKGVALKPPKAKKEQFGKQDQYAKFNSSPPVPEAARKSTWSTGVGAFLARTSSRTLAAELRRKAALQFATRTPVVRRTYSRGLRTPLYAFVGLGVVGGAGGGGGIQIEEEGFTQVCGRIKELFSGKNADQFSEQVNAGCRLDDYQFGSLIAKGCNSAVYAARLKDTQQRTEVSDWNSGSHPHDNPPPTLTPGLATISERSDSEEDDNKSSLSVDSSSSFCVTDGLASTTGSDIAILSDDDGMGDIAYPSLTSSDITIISEEGMEVDSESELDSCEIDDDGHDVDMAPHTSYPLAVKMMFNYDAESNASTIFRTMQNEAVPAQVTDLGDMWENGNRVKKKRLKAHPNIVDMFGVFVDDVPQMPDALSEYPDALPQRLNPEGCGRNKTMFIVMKRYQTTLREYLYQHVPTERESTMLLCQLMEALLHINASGIAHRDLKSDNILLNDDGDSLFPHLVVTDFGCCLADDNVGLRIPYVSDDVTKGGNGSLMAPEIATARPGCGHYLDYRKSDMWAAGTLVYEIFGGENPFYSSKNRRRLDSRTYRSKTLPPLPAHVPRYIYRIARSMLRWRPSRRPSHKTVTNALHLLLWGPSEWRFSLELRGAPPSAVDVMRWLLTFTTGVMVERAAQRSLSDYHHYDKGAAHALQCQFLARLNFDDVMEAVRYLWSSKS